jgi:hypothetical protein
VYTKRLSADKQKNQRASWAQRVLVYPQMIASTDTLDAARSQVVYRDIMNSECTCFTDYKSITWNSGSTYSQLNGNRVLHERTLY